MRTPTPKGKEMINKLLSAAAGAGTGIAIERAGGRRTPGELPNTKVVVAAAVAAVASLYVTAIVERALAKKN